jgi:predicted Zn-dependent protease
MKALADEIRRIEGEGPLWKYAEARRHMRELDDPLSRQWDEARRLLAAARQQRPDWALIAESLGQIEEAAGRPLAAIVEYRRAIEQRTMTPGTYGRAASLLCSSSQYEAAQHVLELLEDLHRTAEIDGLTDPR